jgi:hypothetical protein
MTVGRARVKLSSAEMPTNDAILCSMICGFNDGSTTYAGKKKDA